MFEMPSLSHWTHGKPQALPVAQSQANQVVNIQSEERSRAGASANGPLMFT